MSKHILVVSAVIAVILSMGSVCPADVPQNISFQGKLSDDAGKPITGKYEITFRIYDIDEGGTALWTETDTVSCEEGLYSVILGKTNSINLTFDGQHWLGVRITGDDELAPRYKLTSASTAFRASIADSAYKVNWTNLTDVPAGFADGTDDVGVGGGVSQINEGAGIIVTNPTGPTATVASDIGTGANQVAAGNHNHDGTYSPFDHNHDTDYVNEGQTNSITTDMINDGSVTSSKLSVPLDISGNAPHPAAIVKATNTSSTGYGVYGENSKTGNYGYLGGSSAGVYGESDNVAVTGTNSSSANQGHIGGADYAVYGQHGSSNYGYLGSSDYGAYGRSNKAGGHGVVGVAHSGEAARGVKGISDSGTGVEGYGFQTGVYGFAGSDAGNGVYGICTGAGGTGVKGSGDRGVEGTSTDGSGVYGKSLNANAGVFENTNSSNVWSTLYAKSNGPGWAVHGHSIHGDGHAGYFQGNLAVTENLGIGTETPIARLHISDKSDTPGQGFRIGSGSARSPSTGAGGLVFDTYQSLPFVPSWHQRLIITSLGLVGIGTTTPSNLLDVNGTVEASDLALNATSTEGDITFADRIIGYNDLRFYGDEGDLDMRIRPDGNIGIGTSSPDYKLDVDGTIRGDNVSPSDVRLKKDIVPVDDALKRIVSLRGVNFKWRDDTRSEDLQMGVIAQEVEAVFPEAVSTDHEGYKSVAYGRLIAPLIEAVKDLKAENEELKKEIEELKNLIRE